MDRTTHLTEVELALYVDAIVLDAQVKLPEDILDHVADCTECKVELIDLMDLIDFIQAQESLPHTKTVKV